MEDVDQTWLVDKKGHIATNILLCELSTYSAEHVDPVELVFAK